MMNNKHQKHTREETKVSPQLLADIVEKIEYSLNRDVSLFNMFNVPDGWLGACLFYCYYAQYTDDDRHYQKAEQYLDKALPLVDYKFYKKRYPTD